MMTPDEARALGVVPAAAASMISRLEAGEIHVWAAIPGAEWHDPRIIATLSPEERDRAARFYRERDQQRYIAAHVLVRTVLGRYVGAEPAGLSFVAGARGKPRLAGPGPRFNLAHSGGWAVLAVAPGCEVGVDVEVMSRGKVWREVAAVSLAPPEVAWLRALPESEQEPAFYRLWTAKEAVAKAAGEGMALPPAEIVVGPLVAAEPRGSEAVVRGRRWWLRSIALAPDVVAAVASERRPAAVRLLRWP
jgi:4'-phosphopantetheinyl transferase